MNDKKIAFFLLYWILYSGLIQHFLIRNIAFNVVPDIILTILLFLVAKRKNKTTISRYVGAYVPLIIGLLLFIGSLQMIVNGAETTPYFWNIRFYLRGAVIFYVFFKTMNYADIDKYKHIMYVAIIPNFLMCLYQWKFWGGGDCVGGIFAGGNSEMVLFLLPVLFMVSGDYFFNRKSKATFLCLLTSSMFLAFIGEIKLFYIIIPIFIYISYVLLKRFSFAHIIVAVLLLVFFEPVMKYSLSFFYDEEYVETVFTQDTTDDYTTHSYIVGSEDAMNRGTAIIMTEDLILKDNYHKALGYGIGASSISEQFKSSVGLEYRATFFNLFTPSYIMVEVGMIGYVLFIAIYVIMMLRFYNYYKKNNYNLEVKYWASMGILGCLSTFVLQWYNSTPVLNYNIYYIFLAFCFIAINENIKIQNKKYESKKC